MIIALQTLIFFRESVIAVLERWLPPLGPLFRQLLLTFSRNGLAIENEETEEMVFAEYTDDGGVVFFPPVYAQRYAAVCDCLMDERWYEKLEKVVNMGRHHDMNFIKYLTEVPGIKQILGVDIDCTLTCTSDLLDFTFDNYGRRWEKPLRVTLFQGNAADPDYRLIGCDAVVAIEMIEYMKPHDLDRLVHNIFGFIKPWIAIFTTSNADFNIVFKTLEKSGLRRLDHYFEWTREQLHDWCSNIVSRYPGYTVACRGVGPGPPGTQHYGCCSQLVLFVAKDYHKQMELNVNSLALVANLPQPSQICDFDSDWDDETPRLDISSNNMLCGYTDVESSTEFPYPGYCSCYGSLSPTDSITTLFHDKASQCNLEVELGKSFVMFDVDDMYEVMWPRNKNDGRVYEIGDVASSLNNTMFVVKKFSKTTQNLLDGEEMNYLVHTRGVMDEVSHLTKMLNFTNCLTQGEECSIWNNTNWGENAPYWNQYYKVVAVYNYPYEVKSEDNLILDLISDEINKLLDTQYDDDYSVHVSKLEIPIYKLMETVKHVTEDVDRVIDLLEYNGYEIDGDVVIYSSVVVDDASATTRDEWPDNETYSDWDTTDVNSTISDGSNMPMDFDGRSLRRALDRKVKKLRAMFTHDEDITRELNQVVCRLLKIALSSCRGRQAPVQAKWLQCKLLDLLTLTENAIVRRKARFIERYPLNAIGYETQDDTTTSEMVELCKIKADDTALRIVEKYRHLVQVSDNDMVIDDNNECYGENGLRSEFSTTVSSISTKLPDSHGGQYTATDSEVAHENFIRESSILGNIDCFPEFNVPSPRTYDEDHVSKRIQSWVNKDLLSYPEDTQDRMISSGDDQSSPKSRTKKSKTSKSHRKHKLALLKHKNTLINTEMGTFRVPMSNYIKKSEVKTKRDSKVKANKTLLTKKGMKRKSSYKNLVRKLSNKATGCELMRTSVSNHITNLVKPIEDNKDQTIVQLTAPKPIPDSIIELCQPAGLRAQKHYQDLNLAVDGCSVDAVAVEPSIAATKESVLISIVTDEAQEIVAMRRTVGTDPGIDSDLYEQELELTNLTSTINDDACYETALVTRIVNSQSIFLYDINEPTTSKGLRHVSMDVQCGTDSFVPNYASLSATTSLAAVPKMFTTGIKIGDSFSDVRADNTSDFGTSTHDSNKNCAVMSPRVKSIDIKIQDFDSQVGESSIDAKSKNESNLEDISKNINENQTEVGGDEFVGIKTKDIDPQSVGINYCYTAHHSKACIAESIPKMMTSTEMLKPVCSHIKMEDSGSEFNCSFDSVAKSIVRFAPELSNSRVMMPRFITSKSGRPKLSCGGVHLHSYMDPQISEDVVYQGEWQQYTSKPFIRRKSYNSSVVKKNKDVAVKKMNALPKDKFDLKNKKDIIKSEKRRDWNAKIVPTQVRNVQITKVKDEVDKKIPRKKKAPIAANVTRPPWKPVRKVSSKIGISNIPQKMKSRTPAQPMRRAKSVPPDLRLRDEKLQEMLPLNKYIPSYLSRMPRRIPGQKLERKKFDIKKDTLPTIVKINKDTKEATSPPSKVQDIKTVLLKIPNEPRENVSYVVFRNEIENSNSRTILGETTLSARPSDRGSSVKGAHSPGSPNCSTCSSPNSVATVRPAVWPKPFSSRRHSTPNSKPNVPRSGSDNKISSRIKRFIKKTKVSKKETKKGIENKENIPESSASSRLKTRDADRVVSGGLVGTSNTIFTAQFLSGSHTPNNKSSIKIPFVKSTEDKNKPDINDEKKGECTSQDTNMVLLLEPCRIKSNTQIPPVNATIQEWIVGSSKKAEDCNKSNLLIAMKELIEESLDFIKISDSSQNIDSKTVILTPNRSITKSLNDTSISPSASFKTVINNKSDTFQSAVGTAEDTADKTDNTSVISSPRSVASTANTDLLSFKSVASVSKFSDCFADNESYNDFNSISIDDNAVQDIFERKETILTQSDPGALAIQAFSGYSINAEPVAGDQPDYVNLIDSETGSAAYDTARLATSEEVFVSGRSSGSFASCVLDDDSVVPNWLFQIISQHHSQSFNALHPQEHPALQPELPMQFAVDLDENSNEVGLAVGAGAGDGRGIHSDQSQDSSGRGTSLSSSASSSGAQSEAILIDPSAFIAHFEMMREPGNASTVVPTVVVPAEAASARASDAPSTTHNHEYRTPRPAQRLLPGTSDVEADVSSTDTDVPSDN